MTDIRDRAFIFFFSTQRDRKKPEKKKSLAIQHKVGQLKRRRRALEVHRLTKTMRDGIAGPHSVLGIESRARFSRERGVDWMMH